jgi:Na+-transporting NADH:ubiquinone oxidoreductase subunit NqrF
MFHRGKERNIRELKGRLSVAAIWPDIQNPVETTFYIAGPPPMLKSMTQDLHDCGIRGESIKIDAWE